MKALRSTELTTAPALTVRVAQPHEAVAFDAQLADHHCLGAGGPWAITSGNSSRCWSGAQLLRAQGSRSLDQLERLPARRALQARRAKPPLPPAFCQGPVAQPRLAMPGCRPGLVAPPAGVLPVTPPQRKSLLDVFCRAPDPSDSNTQYRTGPVLTLLDMALLAGRRDVAEIARFATARNKGWA